MTRPRLSRSLSKRPRKIVRGARPKGMPDSDALLKFVREAGRVDKSHIARVFGLKGQDRRNLREMLKKLEEQGALTEIGRRSSAPAREFPSVGVVDVVDRNIDGEVLVRLAERGEDLPAVRLVLDVNDLPETAIGTGERLLVRFDRLDDGNIEARALRRIGQNSQHMLGVLRKGAREARLEPVDRRSKHSLILLGADAHAFNDGDLVLAQVRTSTAKNGTRRGKVLEVIGREDHPRAASLIAIHAHGIPTGFSADAEQEASRAAESTIAGREDLRDIPFVTIDPVDARDHDDAVFAQPDSDPKNEDGWIIWVAIADVAAYVLPGSALDRVALEKGNSVYFPDRVEPMLPERLSNGLCSLREGEDRACLAVRMVFDKTGRKIAHRFVRGLMRSVAKLSYEQVQSAADGTLDAKTTPLMDGVLEPLWAAYQVLTLESGRRSSLNIASSERKIVVNDAGEVVSISPYVSLKAHQLIEEMMIQANVSAAETLEGKRSPLIYRVHEAPTREKLQNLADFLHSFGISWTQGAAPRTGQFNRLLAETRDGPYGEVVNEVVLRTQMQAHYSSVNIGHFGLNVPRYPRFTSPIRRYGDLIAHRALIRALHLGAEGLTDREMARLDDIAESITFAERRSLAAERDATARYIAAFLLDRVGAEFNGRITGVTRFGLFVRLAETGADGLVPVSTLKDDYFIHDERLHALVGEHSGLRWPLGMSVHVRLREAVPITGGLLFEMLSEPMPACASWSRPRRPRRPAPGSHVLERAAKKGHRR